MERLLMSIVAGIGVAAGLGLVGISLLMLHSVAGDVAVASIVGIAAITGTFVYFKCDL